MRRPLALLVAVALVAVIGAGCSSTLTDAATISYTYHGASHEVHVTRDNLLGEVRTLVANKDFVTLLKQSGFTVSANKDSTGTSLAATWLTLLINQEAVDALFTERRLRVTSAEQAQAEQDAPGLFQTSAIYDKFDAKFRATVLARTARREAVIQSFLDTSDAAGQAYYKAHEKQFACASGRNVAHILVATKAAAQAILNQLKAGASFPTLAEKDSTDTQSGAQGGFLGCLAPKEFVAPFQSAAESAPFGQPIGPVQSQFGFHVILVTHATASYANARSQVLQLLTQQGQAAAGKAIEDELKAFHVRLDARFGTWGHQVDSQGQEQYLVTPPKPPQPSTQREGTTTTSPLAPGVTTASP